MVQLRTVKVAVALVITCLNLSSNFSQSPRRRALTPAQIQQRALKSVLVIIGLNEERERSSYCSGFFAKGNTVTNFHCIRNAQKILARHIGQRKTFQLVVIATKEDSDLAALRAIGTPSSPLPLAMRNASVGETVFVLSNPEEYEGTFTRGMVNAYRRSGDMQIDAPLSHGSSGGPVLNSQGEVVGVAHASDRQGQNLNFAIPVSDVSAFLTQRSVSASRLQPELDFSGVDNLISKVDEARAAFAEAEHFMERQQFTAAINSFEKAIRLDARPNYLYGLAQAYAKTNQYARAIDTSKRAIQQANADVPYYFYSFLGSQYERVNRVEDAINAYRAAIDASPQSWISYYSLARLYKQERRFADVLRIYQEAVEKVPAHFFVYMELGFAYRTAGQPSWAMQAFENAAKVAKSETVAHPFEASNYFDLAWAYDELSLHKDAAEARRKEVQLLKREISLKPEDSWVYFKLATVLERLGDFDESIRAYKRAVELFDEGERTGPPKDSLLQLLVAVCKRANDLSSQLWALKQLSILKPKDPSVHYDLGETYLKLGDRANAKAQYRILLTQDREKAAELLKRIEN